MICMKIGLYPGSFDPVTLGHLDIIKRASVIFDEVVVAVLINSSKTPLFSIDERVKILQEAVMDMPNVKVVKFEGLLVDFAREIHASAIVRGLRAVSDFEYELQMFFTNNKLEESIDTIFLPTALEYAYLSSSTVKEVASFGGDISEFVTPEVERAVYAKYNKN